jgi:hypothetical protein
VQVVLDGAWAEEELGADLWVRVPLTGKPGDQSLLCRELEGRFDRASARRLTGCHELAAGALGKSFSSEPAEGFVGGPKLFSGIHPPALATEPLAEHEVCPSEIGANPGTSETLDRLTVELLGRFAFGQ